MRCIDVFNGDADGICALTQLYLSGPAEHGKQLVTGVKRDIELLEQVSADAGDRITVLDISLDKNREALIRLLDRGVEVRYFDHHFAGEIPDHPRLKAVINEAPDVCTSLLVNGQLKNRFAAWAVVGAFGDNLNASARSIARPLGLDEDQLATLEQLGVYLNYNGYGENIADLHFDPAILFQLVSRYQSPLDFVADGREQFQRLADGYAEDMRKAAESKPIQVDDQLATFVLPCAPWARRVSGVFSNDLVNAFPDRAHAILTEKSNGNYLISVRAPLSRKTGADVLCRKFPSGGGRAAAAGINDLPRGELDSFMAQFKLQFTR